MVEFPSEVCSDSTRRRRAMALSLVVVSLGAWLSAAGGCAKPLLSPDEPRTQFDRYDSVRNQYAEQYVYDEWGRRKPNLRGRLLPKE
jgi:hypothetical protein